MFVCNLKHRNKYAFNTVVVVVVAVVKAVCCCEVPCRPRPDPKQAFCLDVLGQEKALGLADVVQEAHALVGVRALVVLVLCVFLLLSAPLHRIRDANAGIAPCEVDVNTVCFGYNAFDLLFFIFF